MDLEDVAAAYRASLPRDAHLTVFGIDCLDRLGVPVVQANAISPDGHATIGYGFGPTAVEAQVGALGELCEEVHVGTHVARTAVRRASYAALIRERGCGTAVDPLTLCLPAGSGYDAEMVLPWLTARRWPSGAEVLVPREWVAAYASQLDEPALLITPITNGLGAGLSLEHAIAHGVLELLQRDGNVLAYRALDQGVAVELDGGSPAEARALLARYRQHGIEPLVKLASTEFGLTNLYVVGDDATPALPVQMTACGEAAHPDRGLALRKALLEFAGSRSRKAATHGPLEVLQRAFPPDYFERQMRAARERPDDEEDRAVAATARWVTEDADRLRHHLAPGVFAQRRRVRFADLPTAPAGAVADAAGRLAWLTHALAAAGHEILWVDCTPPGQDRVRVVKVIVPGLEAETMSYHRIGWRGVQRLRSRRGPLLHDGPAAGAKRVRLRPRDEARAGGPAWFDAARAHEMVGALYPLYREPGPFAAQLFAQARFAHA